jgi:HEPN domain-containing protein
MKPDTTTLLDRAADDQATLHLAGLPEVVFGQHAQAAVEKLIKALINERGERYAHTHDLVALVSKLEDIDEMLPPLSIDFRKLTDYAMDHRYADIDDLATLNRESYLEAVELLRAHVSERIQALSSSTPSPD